MQWAALGPHHNRCDGRSTVRPTVCPIGPANEQGGQGFLRIGEPVPSVERSAEANNADDRPDREEGRLYRN